MSSFTELSAPFDAPDPVVAAITSAVLEYRLGWDIDLDAAQSFTNAGEITLFEWDLDGDGTYEATGIEQTVVPAVAGDYTFRLRVADDQGNSAEVELTVTVV